MTDKILVGADKVRAVAMQLENLRNEAEGAMHNYMGHTQDANAPGIWQGMAAMANVNASQEINDSTIRLTTTWGELINALRMAADTFEQQEEQSRAAINSITNQA
ncbi:hypothetical protein DVS77_00110 [Mycolicibacterium moriokaense]|nr:hypothetical protein DVS77_00110 [Mycolicibacterium moriokaense]